MERPSFEYTYSAAQRKEIERIRSEYLTTTPEASALEELKRLDKATRRPGMIVSIIMGIVGTLVMGGGMSIVMVAETQYMPVGILLGIVGIIIALLAFPADRLITKRQRQKNAPSIVALSDRLLDKSL